MFFTTRVLVRDRHSSESSRRAIRERFQGCPERDLCLVGHENDLAEMHALFHEFVGAPGLS